MTILLKCLLVIICFNSLQAASTYQSACQLFQTQSGNIARCQGDFFQIDKLTKSVLNIPDIINIFELYNASIDALTEDIFQGVSNVVVQKLIISHSSLEHLSIPEINPYPFQSLGDTLENFEVYESSSVFGWNFSSLALLNKLKTLVVEDSAVTEISGGFSDLTSLRFIQLLNASIRWVHPLAFEKIKGLTVCSLANNRITQLKRSMFPQPALHLWSLDLSYNKLKSLPKDLFTNMHSLHELKLDNNQLKRIEPPVINPVWNTLTQLWLDGNDEICWPFCSFAKRKNKPMFMDSSKCYLPNKHKKSIMLDSFYRMCGRF